MDKYGGSKPEIVNTIYFIVYVLYYFFLFPNDHCPLKLFIYNTSYL